MFTVKQIDAEHGGETLWEAKGEVTYTPAITFAGHFMSKRVTFTTMDGVVGTIDRGTVYVVNAAGKTVGTYHMEAGEAAIPVSSPIPIAA